MKSPAKQAARAMAELYIWSAVEELLTSSTAPRSPAGQKASDRMVAACKKQAQRCLRDYDKAVAAADGGEGKANG